MFLKSLKLLYIVVFFIFISNKEAMAQFIGGSSFQYGFIMPHHPEMKSLIKGHVKSAELFVEFPTYGKMEWHHRYNFPTWGTSFYLADLANPQQTGMAFGLYPYFNLPLFGGKSFRLNQKVGWGVGYLTKFFDRNDNHKNIIVGSAINAIVNLTTSAELDIKDKFKSRIAFSFVHFSNASFAQPNLGYNLPSASLAFLYTFGNTSKSVAPDTFSVYMPTFYLSSVLAGGVKEVLPAGGKKWPAFVHSLDAAYRFTYKSGVALTADLYYSTSIKERLSRDSVFVNNVETLQPGMALFYRLYIGKINMSLGMGTYLFSKFKDDGIFYHRFITRYDLNERLFLNIVLKTHFFKADFAEFGVGYHLWKKK